MPDKLDEVRPDLEEESRLEEDEGGPVKSFLEHLEDLRWTLIKSGSALGVAMVVCLIAGNTLVAILKWPLQRSSIGQPPRNLQTVSLLLGTNVLGTFHVRTNELGSLPLESHGERIQIQLSTVQVGTNHLLAADINTQPGGPDSRTPVQLLNLHPAGGFFVAFQVAFYGGLVLASPFLLYFVGQFVVPALKRTEKHYLSRGLGIGMVLFLVGVCFCYFVLLPMALTASVKYSQWLGFAAFQWRAEEYISFVCKFMLGMGLGFELPVVVLMLVRIGIVTADQLAKFRPYMVVINLILGAVLTTPEVLTQVMMFIPLQLLYEVSIIIARRWERQAQRGYTDRAP